jgi:hypothetical protein
MSERRLVRRNHARARAPASIDMLQIVMRCSIVIARSVEPAYAITWPLPPLMPILAMIASITSFAVTPADRGPSIVMRMVFGLRYHRPCVASTCLISEAPMPNAKAPKAPLVVVCESAAVITIPGCARPSSGPTTCMIP